ncbi:MAG: restriction endonuclease subunit S [Wolinella sp.]
MNKQQEPRLRFKGFEGEWKHKKLGSLLNYEQPTKYIVNSTDYDDGFETPVLTAGQSFILGYTNEIEGIKEATPENPIIIFDDFTTSSHYVSFPFKIKSSAMKLLSVSNTDLNPIFVFNALKNIKYTPTSHERHWISTFSKFDVMLPEKKEQTAIGNFFRRLDSQIAKSRAVLEKSRQLKKAMLAKMFPANGEKIPKIRFKGFEGEWESRKLGEISIIKTGISNREDSDLFGEYTFFDRSQDVRKSNTYLYDCEAIIMAGEGSEFFPKHFVGKFDLHQRSYAIMNFLECDGLFVFYYLHLMNDYFCNQAVGSTVKSLRLPMFTEMPILLPTKFEQIQIGNFFRQLDETIALQSVEVEKLNQLKKGLLAAMLV